jgi:ACS family allantoate permease-like MFS transporter
MSVAAVTGLFEDTHINKSQYSWASSVIYLGYLVYQGIVSFEGSTNFNDSLFETPLLTFLCIVPNNILIQRLPHAKYLGVLILLWGVVVAATCVVDSFQQLMGVRFLLG